MSKPDTAHEFSRLYVTPGDTIEQWGYEPDDIVETEVDRDPRYEDERTCLHVWVMTKVEVNDE